MLFEAYLPGQESIDTDHLFIAGQQAALFTVVNRLAKETRKKYNFDICMRFSIYDCLITRFLIIEDTREIVKAL
ncbi:hypothetical protein NPE20_03530 [Mucilaginibacter sp. JC4]|uniref:Uncharacterized protein n=1 Tax=Mucilaginibacter aquariorum TaxID=2967225 RepID=A0ABT1SZ66_9SPHI|nr:hypothetical protein [Mucilaginibacter aquariorum]